MYGTVGDYFGGRHVFFSVLGICMHVGYFWTNEHHMYGVRYLELAFLSVSGLTLSFLFTSEQPLWQSFLNSSSAHVHVLLGLYSSLLIYRLFWHPLRQFPGPFPAKITSLWYGRFVRIGSPDLSITHPLGVGVIYGPKSNCRKASWYDEDHPRASIHTTRDHQFHNARRRVWSKAFSDKALQGYEVRVAKYVERLVQKVESVKGDPINVSQWFKYFSFDVMGGDLAFAKNFGMLKGGRQHWAVRLLNKALGVQGQKLPTWIFRIMVAVPGLTRNYWRFIGYCDEQLDERIKSKPVAPDLMSTLLEHASSSPVSPHELTTLDTTAATLAHVFYNLAKYPIQVQRIRDELFKIVGDLSSATSCLENRKLQYADHLNSVIYETLRLHPVVPSAIVRKTPPEGITIEDNYVAGGMNVWCPQYVLGRSEDVYEEPLDFIPERWYSRPQMIKEKTSFAPFSVGTYGCIGRPLATMEMRAVIAEIVMRFDVDFAKDDDGRSFIEDTTDQFTLHLADLELKFTARR
ncbi:cytochrome P450 [Pleomassaria siparia CBS 279.74]|uniref:Cytochrome P450 n=1 Tax=Pleomassaria siparia CBS 279.74 TaxID=1314801 RepID=A0A6G1KCS6_9PLEO|nr:cytochrome P450 [Pleomassaria siparia CBS 279.74]